MAGKTLQNAKTVTLTIRIATTLPIPKDKRHSLSSVQDIYKHSLDCDDESNFYMLDKVAVRKIYEFRSWIS